MVFQSYLSWPFSQLVKHCTLQQQNSNEISPVGSKYFICSTSTDIKQMETSHLGGLCSLYFPNICSPNGFQSAHSSSKPHEQQDYWVTSPTGSEMCKLDVGEKEVTVFFIVFKAVWLSDVNVLSNKSFPFKLLLLIKVGFTVGRRAISFSSVQWHGLPPVSAANHLQGLQQLFMWMFIFGSYY